MYIVLTAVLPEDLPSVEQLGLFIHTHSASNSDKGPSISRAMLLLDSNGM